MEVDRLNVNEADEAMRTDFERGEHPPKPRAGGKGGCGFGNAMSPFPRRIQ
jgi:hypothetical protein